VSKFGKLSDPCERLMKKLADPRIAAEWDRLSAEYDQREAQRREREEETRAAYMERVRGLPLTQHLNVVPRPWPDAYAYFYGPVGSGKTRMALEHALSVPRGECIFVAFMDYLDLARQIDNSQASGFERDRYDAAFRRRYLVLDDLGARRPTAAAIDYTFKLVSAREDVTRFRTLVTSNCTLGELAQEWDDRIASRIRGFGLPLPFDGRDWRLRTAPRGERTGRFLRGVPRVSDDAGEDSQAAMLSDLEPGRPRNGGTS
jgi:hypothetical protein